MFKKLIQECRAEILEDFDADEDGPVPDQVQSHQQYRMRPSKHDTASKRVNLLLSMPLNSIKRKNLRKMIPYLHHHFEKGHGAGDGEYKTVDIHHLMTLTRHARRISDEANAYTRMPGPAHYLAANFCKHVGNIHDRMSKYWKDNSEDESSELHDAECAEMKNLHDHHMKKANKHGYY